jgi:hypothetical protein
MEFSCCRVFKEIHFNMKHFIVTVFILVGVAAVWMLGMALGKKDA